MTGRAPLGAPDVRVRWCGLPRGLVVGAVAAMTLVVLAVRLALLRPLVAAILSVGAVSALPLDGASVAINYSTHDFVEEVKKVTDGKGVNVVYDGVGQATFLKGLDCLKPRGTMAIFGNASGAVAPFDPLLLSSKGSLYVTRPTLANYISREELDWRSKDLFNWIAAGKLKVRIDKTYLLAEVAQAQIDLAARKTTGKLIVRV